MLKKIYFDALGPDEAWWQIPLGLAFHTNEYYVPEIYTAELSALFTGLNLHMLFQADRLLIAGVNLNIITKMQVLKAQGNNFDARNLVEKSVCNTESE